jgi:hypothetical protein
MRNRRFTVPLVILTDNAEDNVTFAGNQTSDGTMIGGYFVG